MVVNYIYDDNEGTKLGIDPDNNILYIITNSTKYDKQELNKFLQYLLGFWQLVESGDEKYHILMDLTNTTAEIMPMEFYTTLIGTLNDMGKSIDKHLHSMCVLMNSGGLVNNIIKMALKLFKIPRPVKVVENKDDVQPFFSANKLDL